MTFKPVNSSQIKALGHDQENNIMRCHFHRGGIYDYANVDTETFNKVVNAESVGRAFASIIKANKDKYPYTKIA